MPKKDSFGSFKRFCRLRMAQMYVYSYEQLGAIVKQQNAAIAQQAAVINNLRSERQWLEED